MEEADRSSKLTREERLENFTELLKIILKKSNGNIFFRSPPNEHID